MKKLSFFFSFLIISILVININGQDWSRNISLFQTDISTIKKLFGDTYTKQGNDTLFYILPEGNVLVIFSPEPCFPTGWGKFNVASGIVVGTFFYPKIKRKRSFYKLPKDKMEIFINASQYIYRNRSLGFSYSIYSGKVQDITYYPGDKHKDYRCKE